MNALILFITLLNAQEIALGPQFAQQSQHWSYFFSGPNSLQSECVLAAPDMDCRFTFENASGHSESFTILYVDLKNKHQKLAQGLHALDQQWEQESLLTDLWGRLLFLRASDRESLQQIIGELQKESLEERVLMPSNNTRPMSAYFYSQKRAQAVYEVFRRSLSNQSSVNN